MKEQIVELYELGLEKFAGDENAAKAFVSGFLKEAMFGNILNKTGQTFGQAVLEGGAKGLGMGVAGLAIGLGIHGLSSSVNAANTASLRGKFQEVLSRVVKESPILQNADKDKINSFANTIFSFAPKVATDPNLLSTVLVNSIHSESLDPTTIRSLVDLESKIQETRKNALFSPKTYS